MIHPQAASSFLSDLEAPQTFQLMLPDPLLEAPLLVPGKLYYELAKAREE